MTTENFYAELPTIGSFLDAVNLANFASVPQSWYVIITDISGSTTAIESGRYKEVNLLGVCSIAAVLNAAGKIEIPYVFGGDGATILIPPTLLETVKPLLQATQALAQTEFGMHLRVGVVPLTTVVADGYDVKITKLKLSDHYSQALFMGGGLNYATDLVKAPATAPLYQINSEETLKADLTGLECRWQDIPSQHGETVSLLVLATAHNDVENNGIYQEVLEEIHRIYGNEEAYHPVAINHLQLSFQSQRLMLETKVRMHAFNWLDQWLYLSRIQAENILGATLMTLKLKTGEVDWGFYRETVQAASDYKKFDDMLRMVIAGTAQHRAELTTFLDQKYRAGQLVYGLHVSDRALMTCLVYERNGRQMHFIDGADGGYALAAKRLKEKMKRRAMNWSAYTRLIEIRRKLAANQAKPTE